MQHCRWRTKGDIVLRVEEAVIKSAREWYLFVKKKVFNSNNRLSDNADMSAVKRVASVAKLAHLVIADLSVSRQR